MRPHVLLVDDDEHLRTVIGQGLERRFHVTLAGTAEEALRAAAESSLPIDVIVMDIMLPDSWGSQVAMEQQLFLPDAKVIFISGYTADDEILKASIGHGDTPFLAKPFSTQALGALIDEVLQKGEGEEE